MKRRKRKGEEETNYWLSYSDMMAALLLVFVLIISFTMLQSKRQFEEKEAELKIRQQQLEDTQEELDALIEESMVKQAELDEKNTLLEAQQEKLDLMDVWESERNTWFAQRSELESELAEVELELSNKETEMKEKQATVEAQQKKLDKLIGIRSELVEALKEEFQDTSLNVNVDEQTGAITFDAGILFDFGKSDLKNTGKDFLDKFLPRYISILQGEKFKEYIAEIIIEGHTDSVGKYLDNLKLSQDRAFAVAKYCLNEENVILGNDSVHELRKIVTANGRSYSNLIYKPDGTEDADASRRVEFKFRLKDEEMIQEMRNILEN